MGPGEAGEIRAEFMIGGRRGQQEKLITVTTDEAPAKPTNLKLIVDIPEAVAIRPRFLHWKMGDDPEEKIFEITLADPAKVTMRDAQCVNSVFEVELDPGAKPGDLRLRVRPADTARIAQATIRLSATVAGQSRVFVLYAAVR